MIYSYILIDNGSREMLHCQCGISTSSIIAPITFRKVVAWICDVPLKYFRFFVLWKEPTTVDLDLDWRNSIQMFGHSSIWYKMKILAVNIWLHNWIPVRRLRKKLVEQVHFNGDFKLSNRDSITTKSVQSSYYRALDCYSPDKKIDIRNCQSLPFLFSVRVNLEVYFII